MEVHRGAESVEGGRRSGRQLLLEGPLAVGLFAEHEGRPAVERGGVSLVCADDDAGAVGGHRAAHLIPRIRGDVTREFDPVERRLGAVARGARDGAVVGDVAAGVDQERVVEVIHPEVHTVARHHRVREEIRVAGVDVPNEAAAGVVVSDEEAHVLRSTEGHVLVAINELRRCVGHRERPVTVDLDAYRLRPLKRNRERLHAVVDVGGGDRAVLASGEGRARRASDVGPRGESASVHARHHAGGRERDLRRGAVVLAVACPQLCVFGAAVARERLEEVEVDGLREVEVDVYAVARAGLRGGEDAEAVDRETHRRAREVRAPVKAELHRRRGATFAIEEL